MRMRWWVVSGVLWASAALAGERGFQFRATVDTGVAVQSLPSACSDSCAGGFGLLDVGPTAAFAMAPGWHFGLVSIYGGAELQWMWFAQNQNLVRAGPLLGVTFHIERWLVLSLEAKLLFPLLGSFGALGGNLRWGFELSRDGMHQLAPSIGVSWVGGILVTTSVSYVLTL